MKAIRVQQFGEPEVLQVEEVERPVPAAGQILVRAHAIGINPVETYQRSGQYARLPSLPYTPGTDASGVVEAVGPGVESHQVGDRVYTIGSISGAYADYVLCQESQVCALPASATFEQGASLGVPAATAWRALFQKAQALPGETVLVHGATGGVGTVAVQLAKAAGLRVVGTGGTAEGRRLVEKLGAHLVLDHHDDAYLEHAMAYTHGRGFDVVIEFAAHVNLQRDFGVLASRGRIVVIGNRGSIETNFRELMSKDGSVHAMVLFNSTPAELKIIHAALFAALESKTLQPVIARTFALSDAPAAHRAQIESKANGKIILTP